MTVHRNRSVLPANSRSQWHRNVHPKKRNTDEWPHNFVGLLLSLRCYRSAESSLDVLADEFRREMAIKKSFGPDPRFPPLGRPGWARSFSHATQFGIHSHASIGLKHPDRPKRRETSAGCLWGCLPKENLHADKVSSLAGNFLHRRSVFAHTEQRFFWPASPRIRTRLFRFRIASETNAALPIRVDALLERIARRAGCDMRRPITKHVLNHSRVAPQPFQPLRKLPTVQSRYDQKTFALRLRLPLDLILFGAVRCQAPLNAVVIRSNSPERIQFCSETTRATRATRD